ncbi:C-GCAxxG-C-C family protein [Pseudobacteroides cellulosolvens]|uniref:C_GCAxxG_C_C family protein n=1 Tax=Pseudobacteroides cellulosolvens ATCC 35603 = DSM 2933 TaxID=398512 RepID=A0A0L6JWV1_9FIRM|nr:C-GCAxxG-C-C family protein [Pseudobacteroides cellulosolvens]KNY30336.1 C_GCAxxG_C_C family protein [Pseudobacteroides cellulosolvens ATCC 35603 = DSM 2933]
MVSKAQEAVDMFNEGFICSQAVLAALSDRLGLEKDLALKIANGFGGGIARKQLICGAVSGAIMLIGLKYGKTSAQDSISHERTYSIIDKFCDEFEKRNKSIICKDILGCDMAKAREQGLFSTTCSKCVKDAVDIVENLL